jgi:hypothetical protein
MYLPLVPLHRKFRKKLNSNDFENGKFRRMWIAKPIQHLSKDERKAWMALEKDLPLAQTLCWARAIQAVSGMPYLVYSPDEKVGGIVFSSFPSLSGGVDFECINGPHLHWNNPRNVPRQFATFAMAVSKLDRRFASLRMKPRWESPATHQWLQYLPISPFHQTQAATLKIPIQANRETQFQTLTPRLKRTLTQTWKLKVETAWKRATPQLLSQFVPEMGAFSSQRGFTIPPLSWFLALIEPLSESTPDSPSFWIVRSQTQEKENQGSTTELLVCLQGSQAYYLFGYEKRMGQLKSSVSTSATAQWEALLQCNSHGIQTYDLNGYVIDAAPQHPYYGVCRFKEQFAGTIVQYDIPEFLVK